MDTLDEPGIGPETGWRCTWHAGPDAGGAHTIPPGRHVLGRGTPLGCDDAAMEPNHALLELRPDGRLTITQLTGTGAVTVNGASIRGETDVPPGAWVEIGHSLVAFEHGAAPSVPPAHVREGAVVRAARAVPRWTPTALTEPQPPPAEDAHVGGLLPALIGIAGAGVLALVMRQAMFLLFGVLGGAAAVASWGGQRAAFARRRRRAHATHERAVAEAHLAHQRCRAAYRAHHAAAVPTVVAACAVAHGPGVTLWARRATHGDAFIASVGLGAVPWPRHDDDPATTSEPEPAEPVTDITVPVDLGPGARLAVHGPSAPAVARALVLQLATSCGPADLRILVVVTQPHEWRGACGLPHVAMPDATIAVTDEAGLAAALDALEGRRCHLLVVTDCVAALGTRTSPLRRLLADEATALLAIVSTGAPVPHVCTAALTTTHGPAAQWVPDTRAAVAPWTVRVAGLGTRRFDQAATALRDLRDPEDPLDGAAGVPHTLTLADLHALAGGGVPTPTSIAHAWLTGTRRDPHALIGVAADGAVDIDLVRDGPHGLLAGTTGAGKSELLRTLIVGMAANSSPAHLTFVLVDYKGGATFDACAALPHVVGVVTDLDAQLADRALRSLHAELRRRETVLRDHGVADLAALWTRAPHVLLPRLVVVIDEFAALVAEQSAFLHALVGIAQRGRSLGVHLLLATQRPNGVISDDIRANTNLRLALRLQDAADALDVVGSPSAAHLPRRVPGRAVLRLGADEHVTFQAARCTAPVGADGAADGPTQLQVMVRAIAEAARLAGSPAPPAPWQPALPTTLRVDDVAAHALGLVDDPDHQRVTALTWSPDDGHVLVAGGAGSGVSSTLATLAAHTLATTTRHVYVLDGHGDGDRVAYAAVAAHPGCGAVVGVHERERVARLLRILRGTAPAVLVIDGLDAVRRTLDDVDRADEYDALMDLLATADARDTLTIVAGVQHTAAVPAPFLARCTQRWVLHLHDAQDAVTLGVAAADVPPAVPGRAVLAERGLTAQFVAPSLTAVPVAAGNAATRIDATPALVRPDTLAPGWLHDGTTALPVGIGTGDGGTHLLCVHAGEHVLVVGGPRTGRSTALVRIARAWAALHPDGLMGALPPRRGGPVTTLPRLELSEAAAELDSCPPRPVLLVVDDADAVDDLTGLLARFAADTTGRICIVAAGRPDALRQAYGHWTTLVRRSRLGLVAAGGGELDGDLLGTLLPRRATVAPRPGLMWAIEAGSSELVQVATDAAHLAATRLAQR